MKNKLLQKINTKKAIGITLTFIIAFTIGFYTGRNTLNLREETVIHGYIIIETYNAKGELISHYETHNILVTQGATYIRDLLAFGVTNSNFTIYISMSADQTPQASWTVLPNELTSAGMNRAEGSAYPVNATCFKVNHTFTATADVTVNCTGLNYSPVELSETLFCAGSFTDQNLSVDSQIIVTWYVNIVSG